MSDLGSALVPVLLIIPIIDWIATGTLLILAAQPPRIAFLIERALAAVILSLCTTLYALLALNTEAGFPVFDGETAVTIVRLLFITLGAFPVVWLVLYFRRRR